MLWVVLLTMAAAAGAYHFYLSPEARHARGALHLIHTLRLAEIEHGMFVKSFDRLMEEGRITRQQHECLIETPRADIARLQVRGVSAYLNKSELKKVTAYYESPVGQKVLQYFHLEMKARDPAYPIEVGGQTPEFDIDEMEEINMFRQSAAGEKAADFSNLLQQTADDMLDLMRERESECGAISD